MAKKKVVGEDGKTYYMKEKKPIYKRVWFWILVVIVVGGIGGALGGGDDNQAEVNNETKNESNSKANESSKKEEDKAFSIGDTVKVGDVEYIINSKEIADSVGGEYFSENAKAKYLILDVTITNNGNKAITIDSSFFKLYKGETEFESDSMASMYANQENGDAGDFFLESLNPESSLTGKVVFDVNEDTINNPDTQIQVQTGAFGTETGRINLN